MHSSPSFCFVSVLRDVIFLFRTDFYLIFFRFGRFKNLTSRIFFRSGYGHLLCLMVAINFRPDFERFINCLESNTTLFDNLFMVNCYFWI